jgi:leucyl-tRNA synthetase
MAKYQPKDFEPKWAEVWEQEGIYQAPESPKAKDGADKMYTLVMFPYPSGAGLHVGHVRVYTGTDVLARYFRMNGKNVLHPMGWDAFGLPAENAAIKAKKNPKDIVPSNIANFKRQMKMLGLSYDWTREFSTTDPDYYAVTQWLFIEFYKMGLLYKKEIDIYYCPSCKTGIAEEEVLPNGTHERCGTEITRKKLPQWVFRITDYADSLLSTLDGLEWPKGILEMQRNWIGKKEGINITYDIDGTSEQVTVFTTRPDTNFGATFVVLAPEHPFVTKVANGEMKSPEQTNVSEYVKKSLAKTDQERINEGKKKTGAFTGYYAVNNLNGKKLPIYVSDFVLGNFGTGAVVGVPGHDMRDFEFAKAMGIEVVRVVKGKNGDMSDITDASQVQEEEGTMVNSGFLDGMEIMAAIEKMKDYIVDKGYGERVVSYHLRDWIFSRQRYWGEPIPMVHCDACEKAGVNYWSTDAGKSFATEHAKVMKTSDETMTAMNGWFPIDAASLPLELPDMESYEPSEDGSSPLSQLPEWVAATCPHCGGPATRETDTMPNWAGSCWYFLQFCLTPEQRKRGFRNFEDAKNDPTHPFNSWSPVDWYVGGAEHAVLHLLYARFWMHLLNDLGYITMREPFYRLRNVGMVLAEDNRKMSKSFGNVINPDDVVADFGADTLRVYEMFMAPFNQEISWSTSALQGAYRFLNRVWQLTEESAGVSSAETTENTSLSAKLNRAIEKVTRDIPEMKFNTSIAAMMEFINEWEANGPLGKSDAKKFIRLLAPFAPYLAEEIWRNRLGETTSVHNASWPEFDASVETDVTLPVQVNGKIRGTITVSKTADQATVVAEALKLDRVMEHVKGEPKKVVYVPGRILSFIV